MYYNGRELKSKGVFMNFKKIKPAQWIAVTAMFMALNIVLSMKIFAVPVFGGSFYLNDIIICTFAIVLDPLAAVIGGGIGAFLGDVFFYPAPMFVTLVVRSLQALAISLCSHYLFRKKPVVGASIGVVLGAIINVVGYTLGKIFVYSTLEYAMVKLPYQIGMALLGVVLGLVICFPLKFRKTATKLLYVPQKKKTDEK